MSTTTESPPKKEATEAGNYFISNYPPYSFWSPDQREAVESVLDQPPAPDTELGLYIHIPFCRKRCHFCYFRVYTDKNASEIRTYLDDVVREARMVADKAAIEGRPVKFVYFGGGTPSYLSPKQLRATVQELRELFDWSQVEEITFEGEPGTLTEKKLEAIRDIGVTRLSLGFENLNDRILEINGRAHRSPEIFRAYEAARRIGFPQINVDLIAGMLEETEENWQDVVKRTVEMEPDCVTIYQMEIPYNTTIYKEMKSAGTLTAPVADWPTKRRWVKQAFAAFREAGYTVTSGYTAVKDPEGTQFKYRDSLWTGADLVGLGVASFSHLQGVHYQNQHHLELYQSEIHADRLPITRAYSTSHEERLIRELILQMKTGRVAPAYFRDKFGENIATKFAPQWRALLSEGWLEQSGEDYVLNDDGLLQADRLLHGFFLPQHQNARYT